MKRILLSLLLLCGSVHATAAVYAVNDGNIYTSGASAWQLTETASGAQLVTLTGATVATGSVVKCTAFTVTLNDIIRGMLLYCKALTTTGTNTVTVSLYDTSSHIATGANSANCTITCLDTDLPTNYSWVYFKFATNNYHTGSGNATYQIGVSANTTNVANFYYATSTPNWSHMLVQTTTYTLLAADYMYVVGTVTGSGATATGTVTADDWSSSASANGFSAATSVSGGTSIVHATLDVGHNGIFSYPVNNTGTASTICYEQFAGNVNIWGGGQLDIGSSGAVIQTGTTAILEMNEATTNVSVGLIVNDGGTLHAWGNPITRWITATGSIAASATSIPYSTGNPGWLSGDTICIASMSVTASQCETKATTGTWSANAIPMATITNDHSSCTNGVTTYYAECGDLTSNVKIRGITTAYQGYISLTAASTTSVDNAEYYYMGSNTTGKRGIDSAVTTGAISITNSALHDFTAESAIGLNTSATISTGSSSITGNVFWLQSNCGINNVNGYTISSNLFMGNNSTYPPALGLPLVYSSNVHVGFNAPYGAIEFNASNSFASATFNGNICHSNTGYGIGTYPGTIISNLAMSNTTVYRNSSYGIYPTTWRNCTFSTGVCFGNTSDNLLLNNCSNLTFSNFTIDAGTGAGMVAPYGCQFFGTPLTGIVFNTCTFGKNQGHTTADLYCATTVTTCNLYNCNLASSTPITGYSTNLLTNSYIASSADANTTAAQGKQITWQPEGTNTIDSTWHLYGQTYSERLTPNSASLYLKSGRRRMPVLSGATATPICWVRPSTTADGAAYNGTAKLYVLQNVAGGISADTQLGSSLTALTGSIVATTYSTPIKCICTRHGLSENDCVGISGATGGANGNWFVHIVSSSQFTLIGSVGTRSGSPGTFSKWVPLTGTTATTTDNTVLQFVVEASGTTGWVNVHWPAGELYWADGLPMWKEQTPAVNY